MKTDIKADKISELLGKLVHLRRKYAKSKSIKVKRELDQIQELCTKELDYLVEARTRRYRSFANYDDLYQDGRLALYMALQSYEPEKGDFYWWANKYIKTKISREANRHSTIKIPLKHTKYMLPHKVSQMPIIIDSEPSALEHITKAEVGQNVREAISKLPNDQRKVIELHYEIGCKQNTNTGSIMKICSSLKISRANCVKLLEDARNNIKELLTETGTDYDHTTANL